MNKVIRFACLMLQIRRVFHNTIQTSTELPTRKLVAKTSTVHGREKIGIELRHLFADRPRPATGRQGRTPISGLRSGSFMTRPTRGGQSVGSDALCVPSMGTVQRGFKSPVYRTNIEEPKNVLTMKRTTRGQLRMGDRPWEGRLWESHQPMNKNLIRGRRGGMSWHNTAKFCRSATEVNEAVGWRRTVFLPGEICPAWRPAQAGSAPSSNGRSDRAEVSRGHIT